MSRIMSCIALSLLVGLSVCVVTSAQPTSAPASAPAAFTERWNYGGGDCDTTEGTDAAIELLKQSKAAGCTHMLWNDGRTWRLQTAGPKYIENVQRFQAAAKEMNITLCVSMVSIGYSGKYCDKNSNLGAGIPVKEMPYLVQGATAQPDMALALDTSKMEFSTTMPASRPERATRPAGTSRPGAATSRAATSRMGRRNAESGPSYDASGTFEVKPFQLYRISFTTPGEAGNAERVFNVTNEFKRRCSATDATSGKEGDHTLIQTMFNTLEGKKITVNVHSSGKIENLKIEPAGMLLILRRDLIPLVVTNADKSVTYKEGEDFKTVADPIVAVRPFPGEFPMDHPAPVIELTPSSRIKDGQKLLVSFFHHQRIYKDEDCMTLEDPMVWPILEDEIKNVTAVYPTGHYFLNYDEIRAAGWEPMPEPSIKTPGQLLAWHFKKSYDLVRKYAPKATIYTWTDMFTPFHNAKGGAAAYYLVNGNWEGSWEGMPTDVIMLNWYARDKQAMTFFSDKGIKQVLCGYYDGTSTEAMKRNIKHWMDMSQGVPGILGLMYTTWSHNYTHLAEYFQLVDTYADWSKDMGGEAGSER